MVALGSLAAMDTDRLSTDAQGAYTEVVLVIPPVCAKLVNLWLSTFIC